MTKKYWEDLIGRQLKGKVITEARYMTKKETDSFGWGAAGIIIYIGYEGDYFIANCDDEGNGPGALHTSFGELPVIPTYYFEEGEE